MDSASAGVTTFYELVKLKEQRFMPQGNEKTVLVIEDDRNTANLIILY